jgi:hypothetical protein
MYRILSICCLVLLFACAPQEQAEDVAPQEEMAMLSVADVAGEWTIDVFTADPDSSLLTMGMTLSDMGSSMQFPHLEEPVPVTMEIMDDNVVTKSDPYPSAFREGVMVEVTSMLKLVEGNLDGTFTAKYDTDEADSLLEGTLKGVRK